MVSWLDLWLDWSYIKWRKTIIGNKIIDRINIESEWDDFKLKLKPIGDYPIAPGVTLKRIRAVPQGYGGASKAISSYYLYILSITSSTNVTIPSKATPTVFLLGIGGGGGGGLAPIHN